MFPKHCTYGGDCPEFWAVAPFAFLAIWYLVMVFISKLGGWTLLAETYRLDQRVPDGRMPEGPEFNWRSAVVNKTMPASYSNCLNFTLCHEGLGIAPIIFFRWSHPPLFIPWRDITPVETTSWGRRLLDLRIGDTGVSIKFWQQSLISALLETRLNSLK